MKSFFKRYTSQALHFLKKPAGYTPLQIAVHLYAWSVIVLIAIDFITGHVSVNPIQELEQRTGRQAITLLVLSLACTPLNTLFHWSELLKRRRALGLYAFMYAAIHVIIFVDLDYGLAWSLIAQTIFQKPYILVGMISFLLLVPLAFTSFNVWKMRLKKNWKRLHQLVYLIAPLVVLHYGWSKKGDFFALRGEIVRPLIYGLIVMVLLLLRLHPVRRAITTVRGRLLMQLSRWRMQQEV
ncbi:MAG: sulfite oxidase heme-binding subunit YedZ [Bacteroidota bacterium]